VGFDSPVLVDKLALPMLDWIDSPGPPMLELDTAGTGVLGPRPMVMTPMGEEPAPIPTVTRLLTWSS
jgi:hypothetical protein